MGQGFKIIFIGDPHIQPMNLAEADRLMSFVIEASKNAEADTLVIPGDLFHNHAVLRMEVLDFWSKWIKAFSSHFKKVHILPGNHDQPGDRQRENSISALDVFLGIYQNVYIWNKPGHDGDLGFIPHTSNHGLFIQWAKELHQKNVKRLFCHQTFDGSKYDNGFYAPDGIDLKLLPEFDEVISGHIHTEQSIGIVFYPGTPKWDSLSDANQEKGIWVSGGSKNWKKISTANVCVPIIKKTIHENSSEEHDIQILENTKTILELIGSSAWISKISKKMKGKCRIVGRPTDSIERKKASSTEKLKNIFEYLENKKFTTNKEKLKKYIEELCL